MDASDTVWTTEIVHMDPPTVQTFWIKVAIFMIFQQVLKIMQKSFYNTSKKVTFEA